MNVQPGRKYKNNFKDGGGKNAGGTSKGSRFDALRQVGEDFGREVNRMGSEPSLSSKTGKAMENVVPKGSKIWTKSKLAKDTSRQVLNDISNKVGASKSFLAAKDKIPRKPFGTSFDAADASGVAQFSGKEIGQPGLVSKKIDSWVGNHDASIENGVYIFGHQPLNIREEDVNSEASSESDDDAVAVDASIGVDVGQGENMDLSEGQGAGPDDQMTCHTLTSEGGVTFVCWNVRGAASTKFKSTMLDLIRIHRMDILFVCEPRISGEKAISVVKSLGFHCFEIVDAIGFSGGLWLLWDNSKVHVEILGTSDQTISACVSWNGGPPWLFTGVYASPCIRKRASLWEYLKFVADCHHLPWLLAGDFNEMLSVDEKLGGAVTSRVQGFRNWFDDHGMVDLGFSGPKYTWRNNKVSERIDRAICMMNWRGLYAEAHVRHLPRTTSDHNPLKISLQSCFHAAPHLRPFRFEAMWLKHEKFGDFINNTWGKLDGSAMEKTFQLVARLKHWNINVFGHLRLRKARLLARLNGIQKALCEGFNPFLSRLEVSLMDDFNKILEQEAQFWKQKSRVQWLQEGDRNTKFFHLTTVIRRRRNKIESLRNNDGMVVATALGIKALAVEHFASLFTQSHLAPTELDIPNLFPLISGEDLDVLTKDVELDEVKESLFGIGGLKAPGIDGFPACFYQTQWGQCATDIYAMVTKAFTECSFPAKLNHTLITLVPKVDNPQTMVHFRPISLCSTLYKVISKIIVARLRPILPVLISPNQVSFVPRRHITDNILIAQELMHKFKVSKGKRGFMAWKIDLSKAYDILNWHFIEVVLAELGMPAVLRRLIMHCVSTVKYQICINGELTDSFAHMNGIRQGDPLSPYLFVMCVEKLSHIIFDLVQKGSWKAVKSSQSGPVVSHLFFADDLILFAEASVKQARIMKGCLELFCQASGQIVNFDKSAVFCSSNTPKEVAKEISCICGSPQTSDLGKYLGMPLLHTRVNHTTYKKLLDRVHSRLASWKGKLLSYAGRATLIQAVTSSIPIDAMQTTKLPWNLVFRPKCKGGLGFKKSAAMNQALLAKIGWRIQNKDGKLWARIYKAKYLKVTSILDPSLIPKQVCSSTWRGILHGVELLSKGMVWRIGKRDTVKFWQDRWLNGRPLFEQDGILHVGDVTCNVSSFLKGDWWDIDKLRAVLDEDLVHEWPSYDWHFLWKLKIPPKLQIFLWLVFQGKILSNEQRVRRHLVDDPACNYCNWPVESILHIFRDCEKATSVWQAMLCPGAHPHFFQMDFHPWLRSNLLSKAMWGDHVPWPLVFVFTCWVLWKWRNNQIFNIDNEVSYEPEKIIVAAVREWYTASQVGGTKAPKMPLLLTWEPPELGQFKLNVDGSRRCASGSIGAEGVIRNSLGDWVSGFAVNLGKGQILEAEVWGLFFGLQIAIAKGIRRLSVEMDAATAVLLVQQHSRLGSHPLASLIARCCAMVRQIGVCYVSHIYRERNAVVDCLAKWSHNLDLGLCVLDAAPSWLGSVLVDDLLGVPRTRWVSLASG
ncbi:uncharacterized protein LOC110768097 [Prunus avium]|uniref:Uncharacterized protein LOC110768097 n=1 Tax=Prunus avium TaxID=42229 RepID=A0A6P5TJX5_PRUAV|nr:uncharacterized protein LOC110768097 [Prunus avium]